MSTLNPIPNLRTFLVLGRVTNLPTIWTNCLAGWWLGGGGHGFRCVMLATGASVLYTAGMFLNDAFDASFDHQRRRERPIPRGQISEALVWRLGFGMLGVGWLILASLGIATAGWALLLVGSILIYNSTHKAIPFSPVLMALCRVLLFLTAASAGSTGIDGLSVWTSFALGGWIIGLSYIAKRESYPAGALQQWPLVFLALPLLLAFLADNREWRSRGLIFGAVLLVWAWMCLRHSFAQPRNYSRTVAGLLAGICIVDLLAVAPAGMLSLFFFAAFVLALVAQRRIPAT